MRRFANAKPTPPPERVEHEHGSERRGHDRERDQTAGLHARRRHHVTPPAMIVSTFALKLSAVTTASRASAVLS